jgi:hypothetical protein
LTASLVVSNLEPPFWPWFYWISWSKATAWHSLSNGLQSGDLFFGVEAPARFAAS